MNAKTVTDTYLRDAVESAPPIKIIRMLYQGAIRCLAQATAAGVDDPAFSERVGRADQIVTELRLALRPDVDAQQCQDLESLYEFVGSRLMQALEGRTPAPLADARAVLEKLLEAWNEVELGATDEA